MKHLIPAILLGLLLLQCQPASQFESSNISIARKYIEAIEKQDYDLLDSLTRDDFYVVGPSIEDTASKEQIIRKWKRNANKEIDSIRFRGSRISHLTIPSKTEFGDWIGEWSVVFVYYKGLKEPVRLFANTNYLIVDGKLVKGLSFYNEADLLGQKSYIYTKEMIQALADSLEAVD